MKRRQTVEHVRDTLGRDVVTERRAFRVPGQARNTRCPGSRHASTVAPGGAHAPSAAVDGMGGAVNILNINDGRETEHWDQFMSLPQHLTLGPDDTLRIEPLRAIAALRADPRHVDETILPANREIVLEGIQGSALEIEAEIDPREARWVQLNLLRSPQAEEQTSVTFYNDDRKLASWYPTQGVICLDGSRGSTLPDAWPRPRGQRRRFPALPGAGGGLEATQRVADAIDLALNARARTRRLIARDRRFPMRSAVRHKPKPLVVPGGAEC